MSFNKWFPDRPVDERRWTMAERRAFVTRGAWWISSLMLISGYVLMVVFWDR